MLENPGSYGAVAVEIRSRASGRTWTFQPGQVADLRRHPEAAVPLENPKISRSGHARLIWEDGTPVLVNDGDSRGIFVNGTRQAQVSVTSRMVVRLGTLADGEDLELNTMPATAPLTVPPDRSGGGAPRTPGPGDYGTTPGPVFDPDAQVTHPVGGGPKGPSLTVTCGTVTQTLAAELGPAYLLGRSSTADVQVDDDGVSRNHLRLRWDGTSWAVTDLSSKGTFRADDGHALPPNQAVEFDDVLALRLGSPTSGTHVTLAPAGAGAVAGRRSKWLLPAAVAAAVVAIIVAIGTTAVLTGNEDAGGGDGGGGGDNTVSRDTIAKAKPSVVRIQYATEGGTGTGSGTILSEDGLILTNAHVGDPNAVGLTGQYGYGWPNDDDPEFFLIGITTKPDAPAEDLYRAKLLVSDGYLDLAVLKVTANADGSPLDGDLSLPVLPVADSDKVRGGDAMEVLGFPGAADSKFIVSDPGQAGAPVTDKHLDSDRAWFDTSATVRHGNSGGTVINTDGELIAVPTRSAPGQMGDNSERVRPVNWAKDIIAIAEKGGDPNYESPWVRTLSGKEEGRFIGVSKSACDPERAQTIPAGSEFAVNFAYVGAPERLDLYPLVVQWGANDSFSVKVKDDGSWPASREDDGCVYLESSKTVREDDVLAPGAYHVVLFAGPNGDEILAEGDFTIVP